MVNNEYVQIAELEVARMFKDSGFNISEVKRITGLSRDKIRECADKYLFAKSSLVESLEDQNILVISDMHIPYHHRDSFTFLEAVTDKYEITKVINVGDLLDKHQTSYHQKEHEAYGVSEEFKIAKDYMQDLVELFPSMDIAEGNHDALTMRKAKDVGIQKEFLKSPNEAYDLPDTWIFQENFLYTLSDGSKLHMRHSLSSSTKNNAKAFSINSVQGHHHSEAGIEYYADTELLRWSMSVGCLIDLSHKVFTYNKSAHKRPILSVGCIINSRPILVPMTLNTNGRWNGKL